MAIKFSQFVVQTDASTLSHIVGYDGVDNIQITPTNFLNSLLTGTAGQVLFYDTTGVTGDNGFFWDNTNKRLGIGTTSPDRKLEVESTGTGEMCITGTTGSKLFFRPTSSYSPGGNFGILVSGGAGPEFLSTMSITGFDSSPNTIMTLKGNGNVGIGTTAPTEKLQVAGNVKVGDSQKFIAGSSSELQISHNGTDSQITNTTGNLQFTQLADNKDISFASDNGSGGDTIYMTIDGGTERTIFSKDSEHSDNVSAYFGSGNNMRILYNGTHSFISQNVGGDLRIVTNVDDGNILFQSDDGGGGLDTYFSVVGAGNRVQYNKNLRLIDNVVLSFGSDDDLQIQHNSGASLNQIDNLNGDLYIQQNADNKDIIFRCDDGSGGLATYFFLDGSLVNGTSVKGATKFPDASKILMGTDGDLEIFHNGSQAYIENYTGTFNITQHLNDGDMVFKCDNGSGGVAEYFRLDGGTEQIIFSKEIKVLDDVIIKIGGGGDLRLSHNSTSDTSFIGNVTGDLTISNSADDGDIIFKSDDGAGGTTEYFKLEGTNTRLTFSKNAAFSDNVKVQLGSSVDFEMYHDGTDTQHRNFTGDLLIKQEADDKDVYFQCDNGSGGLANYFYLDGGNVLCRFEKSALFADNVSASFGNSFDLQIYHDTANNIISSNTGQLKLLSNAFLVKNNADNETLISAFANDTVILYNNNTEKLRTTGSGIRISGVSEYTNNTAALAAGLVVGDVYRTGDDLKIVH